MKDVKKLLENHAGVDDWRISEKATASYELFFVHERLETVRATDTVTTHVTVYADHDGKKGDSSFTVYQSMTAEDTEKKIESAVRRARLVFNEPYDLPEGGKLNETLPTNMGDADPKELGARIARAVFAADTAEGGSINACEIFLYWDTVRVMNSRGVDKTQKLWRVMIEAIPTFTSGQDSVELYEDYRFTAFDPERVTKEIAARMKEARDRFEARKPQTPLTVNVILRPKEISELLEELAYDLNYASVYAHANLHKTGDDLQAGGDGDKLTLTMKAILPGSERSGYFDEDGVELHDVCVIRDGVAADYFGASRFGQYLGIQRPSGKLDCMKAAPGTMKEAEMRAEPYLECASLSGLQLDLYNDYIGGEIRLAYYDDGTGKIPVTGITMSAKLSQVLSSLRLSDRTVLDGAYEGPEYLLMKNVTVL